MVQTQPVDKLHAACDDCRTRKLKCSGHHPECNRCKRERLECIYSPQKTMGRPRKRRRGEADGAEVPTATQNGHNSTSNGFSQQLDLSSLGLVSPPDFADLPNGNELYDNAQHDRSLVGVYEPSPPMSNLDFGLTPPIDPSLWSTQPFPNNSQPSQTTPSDQTAMGPCTCLSLTYLTLTDLQTVPNFAFPQVIIPLRKAMTALSSIIHCPICPLDPFSAIQNISSIVALFKAIVERFSKVLQEVDREAAQLTQSGEKKPYRIGDLNPALSHLHTGTVDCPMGFNVELEPDVWKSLVKTALRTEMYGGGSNSRPLKDLLRECEDRQRRWHTQKEFFGQEWRGLWGREHCETDGHKSTCEALGDEQIRRAMGMLNWS